MLLKTISDVSKRPNSWQLRESGGPCLRHSGCERYPRPNFCWEAYKWGAQVPESQAGVELHDVACQPRGRMHLAMIGPSSTCKKQFLDCDEFVALACRFSEPHLTLVSNHFEFIFVLVAEDFMPRIAHIFKGTSTKLAPGREAWVGTCFIVLSEVLRRLMSLSVSYGGNSIPLP